jgi:hypothetical protein
MKAYQNNQWINSASARLLRIVSEYLEPEARFNQHKVEDTIVFMGSARLIDKERAQANLKQAEIAGQNIDAAQRDLRMSQYYQDCQDLAFRLTQWSKELPDHYRRFVVCSGGGPGIMEAANRGASEAGGINVGLGISLPNEQENNPHITRELSLEFHYFFMRKFWFTYLAKAIVLFPGGYGTLDELFETLTLLQTGKIRKHLPLVLFGTDYWSQLINFEVLIDNGMIAPEDLNLFISTDCVDIAFHHIVEALTTYGLTERGSIL